MPKQRWDEARRREALRRSRIRSRMSSSSTYFYGTLMLVITTLALRGIAAAGPDYACKQAETTSGEGKLIPGSWVNDDFCDCPLGDDEPLTSACSSVTKTDASFICQQSITGEPQHLPASRVNDGVPDCCDASDEPPGAFPDACAEAMRASIETALADFNVALVGKQARDVAVREAAGTKQAWQNEIHEKKALIARYTPAIEHLRTFAAQEEQIERWEKFVWWRQQQHKKAEYQQQQQQESEVKQTDATTTAAEEGRSGEGGEEEESAAASSSEEQGPPPSPATQQQKITITYNNELGLVGTERVLKGMIASDGLRSLSLNDYLQEQDLMARGLKEKPTATSVASSLIAEMGPKDVIEMNLQALGALVVGPFKAVVWSFKICLQEAFAALGKKDKEDHRKQEANTSTSSMPLHAWWKKSIEPTAIGWVLKTLFIGPDALAAFFLPHTIEDAPERLEAALLYHAIEKVEEEVSKLKNDIRNLETQLHETSSLYGPDSVFLTWKDKCFTKQDNQYEYKVCPFIDAKQGYVDLGKWKGWHQRPAGEDQELPAEGEQMGKSMLFAGGQKCYNGPERSLAVTLVCGGLDEIVEVSEPSICVYDMVMTTPLVCDASVLQKAQKKLKALGVEGENSLLTEAENAGTSMREEL